MDEAKNSSRADEFICRDWKDKSIKLLKSYFAEERLSIASESTSSLLKEKELIQKKIESILEETKHVQKELEDIESENPRDPNKYKIQLFQEITNIVWDVECSPNEVKGYVSGPFETFSLDKESESEYSITDYLWKLIGNEKPILRGE